MIWIHYNITKINNIFWANKKSKETTNRFFLNMILKITDFLAVANDNKIIFRRPISRYIDIRIKFREIIFVILSNAKILKRDRL